MLQRRGVVVVVVRVGGPGPAELRPAAVGRLDLQHLRRRRDPRHLLRRRPGTRGLLARPVRAHRAHLEFVGRAVGQPFHPVARHQPHRLPDVEHPAVPLAPAHFVAQHRVVVDNRLPRQRRVAMAGDHCQVRRRGRRRDVVVADGYVNVGQNGECGVLRRAAAGDRVGDGECVVRIVLIIVARADGDGLRRVPVCGREEQAGGLGGQGIARQNDAGSSPSGLDGHLAACCNADCHISRGLVVEHDGVLV